jgi:hypothetical protein
LDYRLKEEYHRGTVHCSLHHLKAFMIFNMTWHWGCWSLSCGDICQVPAVAICFYSFSFCFLWLQVTKSSPYSSYRLIKLYFQEWRVATHLEFRLGKLGAEKQAKLTWTSDTQNWVVLCSCISDNLPTLYFYLWNGITQYLDIFVSASFC